MQGLGTEGQRRATQARSRLLQDLRGDHGDVAHALAQGRHDERGFGNAEIQVFAETPGAHVGLEIAVRGAQHAHIHGHRTCGAHRTNFAFLKNP